MSNSLTPLPMGFAEYAQYDGLGLAQLVHDGKIRAEELAQMAAAAVNELNPRLNAVIEVWQDRVEQYDQEANLAGPFGGVPFFIKDLGVSEQGRLQEMGSRMMKRHIAPVTTELARRFKRAGLNLMGRTTCPDNAYTFASESVLNGQTHNPWSLDHVSGGSSSGSAAVVAAGIVPMASASDGGGSTRIPASICGLVGLKPSRGRLSMAPFASDATIPEATEGVLSRTVCDTAILFDEISGSGVGEFIHAAPPRRPYAEELTHPRHFRVAMSLKPWGPYSAAPHIIEQVVETASLLESLGHEVVPDTPAIDFAEFFKAFSVHWIGGTLALDALAEEMGVELSPDLLEHMLYEMVVKSREVTLAQWLQKEQVLMHTTRALDVFFVERGYDLVLTPTMAIDTPPLGSLYRMDHDEMDAGEWLAMLFAAVPYTPLANATGVPAISLPLGIEGNGLPLGMHFMGRWGSEDKLLNLAAQLEKAQPWAGRTPAVHVSHL